MHAFQEQAVLIILNAYSKLSAQESTFLCHFADDHIVLSAPTGSGKTTVFELAIVRLLTVLETQPGDNSIKMVYGNLISLNKEVGFQDYRVFQWPR